MLGLFGETLSQVEVDLLVHRQANLDSQAKQQCSLGGPISSSGETFFGEHPRLAGAL